MMFTSEMADLIARQRTHAGKQAVFIVLSRALNAQRRSRGHRHFPMASTRLADLVGQNQSTATRLLQRLMDDGFLVRVREAKTRWASAWYAFDHAFLRQSLAYHSVEQVGNRFGLVSEQILLAQPEVLQRIHVRRRKKEAEMSRYWDAIDRADAPPDRPPRRIRRLRRATEKKLAKLRAKTLLDPSTRTAETARRKATEEALAELRANKLLDPSSRLGRRPRASI